MRLRAGQRLRRNGDFRAVREQGRRLDCGVFQFTWRVRPPGESATPARVGVVASRASVGNAVMRARAKRRLRELYRKHQHLVPPTVDLVLTARGSLLRIDFAEAAQRFIHACGKLPPPSPTHA
ncbi:ribonuclease P [Lacunisphaera limnophila]|uniref:Ribonuclease P protein component n=1 Tax=Lacunisphaera limnophila TaxID=1838286 RepID=A0A1D8ATD7_9BACT|nr:ribonuclease P protein component [Lacunisphaera limnophila]AOS44153.1 ribonuclease P [Lacunisphaera limnophila]